VHLPHPVLCMTPGTGTGWTAAPGISRARTQLSRLLSQAPCMPLPAWQAMWNAAHTSAAQAACDTRPCRLCVQKKDVHSKLLDTEVALQTEMGQLRARLAKYEAEHSQAVKAVDHKTALITDKDTE
jgi:hypothetical protein